MYTNFVSSKGKFGYSRPFSKFTIKENKFRSTTFLISHLRAFYTKLLTLVKEKDLKDENGNWFRAANDVAMYSPIL
jgi:nuclear transport factor 2 (NTF2) superfamily protein